jgi:hypothetical protein
MTSGNAGRTSAWIKRLAIAGTGLLASCGNSIAPLRPAWQQDPNLFHQGFPARESQMATTPHMVARIVYAAPDRIAYMVERQGDVPDRQRGFSRMGDGTLDLAVQDVATGKGIESILCGGILFVASLPNQAYRIVLKNRTPMPLQLGIGIDGKDLQTGRTASLQRGTIRMEKHASLTLDHASRGPLLFKSVNNAGLQGVDSTRCLSRRRCPQHRPRKTARHPDCPPGLVPHRQAGAVPLTLGGEFRLATCEFERLE